MDGAKQAASAARLAQQGDYILVRAQVTEAYDSDCCIEIVTGTKGYRQLCWIPRAVIAVIGGQAPLGPWPVKA